MTPCFLLSVTSGSKWGKAGQNCKLFDRCALFHGSQCILNCVVGIPQPYFLVYLLHNADIFFAEKISSGVNLKVAECQEGFLFSSIGGEQRKSQLAFL